MDKVISLKDIENIQDKLLNSDIRKAVSDRVGTGVKGTRIRMKNLETGEVKELHNKVVISGSVATASNLFIIDPPVDLPTYNEALDLENSVYHEIPQNAKLICLFGIGDDGCGTLDSDVYYPSYVDRIPPEKLFPFRYIPVGYPDLDDSERETYYGRKVNDDGSICYYFKAFNNDPQLYLRYTDGTEITPATMYNAVTSQEAECYVQLDLSVNRVDFREYFEHVLGWDKARISSLSLVLAWYTDDGVYKWYQDIIPFTKLNFSYEKLVDSSKALAFEYALFF